MDVLSTNLLHMYLCKENLSFVMVVTSCLYTLDLERCWLPFWFVASIGQDRHV